MKYLWLLTIGGALMILAACGHTRIDREPETTAIRPTPGAAVQARGWQTVSPTQPAARERSSRSIATGAGSGRTAVNGRWSIGPRPRDVGARVQQPRLRLPRNPERIPGLQPR